MTSAYTTVGSACIGMLRFSRFRYTAATSGRSSALPVSFSTSDASVTICLSDRSNSPLLFLLRAPRRSRETSSTIMRDELRRRHATRQRIRLRKEITLEILGRGIEIVHERSVTGRLDEFVGRAEPLRLVDRRHLPDSEAFWERDRMCVHVASGDLVDDLDNAHRPIEAILARLERT